MNLNDINRRVGEERDEQTNDINPTQKLEDHFDLAVVISNI